MLIKSFPLRISPADLVTFTEEILNEKLQPATLLKLTLLHGRFHVFQIVQMVPNRATHHICLKISL